MRDETEKKCLSPEISPLHNVEFENKCFLITLAILLNVITSAFDEFTDDWNIASPLSPSSVNVFHLFVYIYLELDQHKSLF